MLAAQLRFLAENAPCIPPLAEEGPRPFWSIVIPTYDRPHFLSKTLASVLDQDRGPERMAIEVVDDASPTAAARDIVERHGRGRVTYYRQPENLGQFRSVNEGIRRARGYWIHVLHDDDWVEPGFYARLEEGLVAGGPFGAALTALSIVNMSGDNVSAFPLERDTSGPLHDWMPRLATSARVQTPGVVVRREVYEVVGGYNPDLPWPGDWEMWQRIAAHYAWWYEPRAVACYREHGGSISGGAKHTGRNIAQVRAAIDFAQHYLPPDLAPQLRARALRYWAIFAVHTARRMLARGDWEGAAAQLAEALRTDSSESVVRSVIFLGSTFQQR